MNFARNMDGGSLWIFLICELSKAFHSPGKRFEKCIALYVMATIDENNIDMHDEHGDESNFEQLIIQKTKKELIKSKIIACSVLTIKC